MEPATGVQCLLCKYHLVWSVGAAVGLALAFVVPAAYHEQPLVSLLLFGGPAQASPRYESAAIRVEDAVTCLTEPL